jgi:hypothetical protein
MWQFAADGLMSHRCASINDEPIEEVGWRVRLASVISRSGCEDSDQTVLGGWDEIPPSPPRDARLARKRPGDAC